MIDVASRRAPQDGSSWQARKRQRRRPVAADPCAPDAIRNVVPEHEHSRSPTASLQRVQPQLSIRPRSSHN